MKIFTLKTLDYDYNWVLFFYPRLFIPHLHVGCGFCVEALPFYYIFFNIYYEWLESRPFSPSGSPIVRMSTAVITEGIRPSPRKHSAASGIYPLTVRLLQEEKKSVNKSYFFFLELFINPNRKQKYVTVLLEVKNIPQQPQEQNTLRCIPLSSLMNAKERSLAWLTQSI